MGEIHMMSGKILIMSGMDLKELRDAAEDRGLEKNDHDGH